MPQENRTDIFVSTLAWVANRHWSQLSTNIVIAQRTSLRAIHIDFILRVWQFVALFACALIDRLRSLKKENNWPTTCATSSATRIKVGCTKTQRASHPCAAMKSRPM